MVLRNFLLFFFAFISFYASAQHTLDAAKAKRFSDAYQVNNLLGSKSVDVAVQIIDSMCDVHSADQELVGVIRVNFIDWLRYKANAPLPKNYLLALRRVKEPFYQHYLLCNHFQNKPFYGSSDAALYERIADSVATSLLAKVPSSEIYQLRGILRFCNKNFKAALVDFESAVRLSYGRPNLELLDYAAEAYSENGNYPSAIMHYTMELDSAKNKKSVLLHRGLCKREVEDYRGALSDFSKALLINEQKLVTVSDCSLLSLSASCKLSLGEYLDAKVILNRLTPKQITDGDAGYVYYLKGLADYQLKYKESACANWSKSGENGYAGAYEAIKSYCNKR